MLVSLLNTAQKMTFTGEILNGNFDFLCDESASIKVLTVTFPLPNLFLKIFAYDLFRMNYAVFDILQDAKKDIISV